MYSRFASVFLATIFTFLLFLSPSSGIAMPGLAAQSGTDVISGTIKETMNASGYTYMLVTSAGIDSWVAIPETPVEKGADIQYYQGMEMKDFNSKTLNRTFPSIIFSSGIAQASDKPVEPETVATKEDDSFASVVKAEKSTPAAATINETQSSGGSAGAIVPLAEVSVEKATAANSYTVSELFSQAKELAGKKVQVRGKVMKVSPAIMGRNWIHIQDGTGDPMKNTHDLVVTTNETIEPDTIVTFEGVITANKDFGAGYKYDAIVEEAIVIK
jgi:hypothetical protein